MPARPCRLAALALLALLAVSASGKPASRIQSCAHGSKRGPSRQHMLSTLSAPPEEMLCCQRAHCSRTPVHYVSFPTPMPAPPCLLPPGALPPGPFANEGGPAFINGATYLLDEEGQIAAVALVADNGYVAGIQVNGTLLAERGVYTSWECDQERPGEGLQRLQRPAAIALGT